MFEHKEHLDFSIVGAQPKRSYYIPFNKKDSFTFKDKILDRSGSSEFLLLDGEWEFKKYDNQDQIEINSALTEKIPVPSCVQMYGYDKIQYLNCRYPFSYDPPHVPFDSPVFHYRKEIEISDGDSAYYLNFEGVDSGFYLFVNKEKVGYSQIAHSTSEFDVTQYLTVGKNVIDVIVFKWCAGTYLECQDKFRFSGIFRSVYILKRPKEHITDYKINVDICGEDGEIEIINESAVPLCYSVLDFSGRIKPSESERVRIENAKFWTAENPYLYDVELSYGEEKILNRIGIRTSEIKDGIFLINGKHEKLKGVNRHEFNSETGATVTFEDTLKDIILIKELNANAIRTSHYPDAPEFYDLCDAYGFYVIDEADLETHGMFSIENNLGYEVMYEQVNNGTFDTAVLDREISLVERDKNRTCVVMWSLGNESCFGSMLFRGIDYIKNRDGRPIHYQGVEIIEYKDDYYTDKIDVIGRFYPPLEFFDKYLNDEREKRPLVLTEYLHAMGNSCGGLDDYWTKINSNDRFIGAFVWEFCDHAIKTDKGFLYGGDFGETEHDGNFCVDGLVAPDRTLKSNYLEVQAKYGNLTAVNDYIPTCRLDSARKDNPSIINTDAQGKLTAVNGFKLKSPLKINVIRAYTDNDVKQKPEWQLYENNQMQTYKRYTQDGKTVYQGKLAVNTLKPIMEYTLIYQPINDGVDVTLKYKVADYVSYLARVGFEFAIDENYQEFEYEGYGETESYVDKRVSSKYGEYKSTADENFNRYIKPQENGSHCYSTRLKITDALTVTADKPFSFSVLPYSTKEIMSATHDFELPKRSGVWINLDLSMSGVGTASCGPDLPEKYRAQKTGETTFRITKK